MTSGVLVVGAGGHAKVVIDTLQAMGQTVTGVLDDRSHLWGGTVLGVPVLGGSDLLGQAKQAVIAIGSNQVRQKIAQAHPHVEWIRAVHPRAQISPSVQLGPGTVVFAGAVVQPDTQIGSHCIINTAASVDHDGKIEDFVHIAPGCHLAGNVSVLEGAFLGVGTCVIPGMSIGAWSTVGAGATVVRPVADHLIVVGTPARPRTTP
ncbi:acetyltransferase [Deinococcus roseus]|uniref:Hexapeptide transferase n=1 Tax=Deinococcus roseus TaxID=392414 RepID=A0ABQ2CVG3_9DEIO|nr:acetyltransferase [Deinococcus roseus]GGJ24902.1 hexapeptide transferase [Deinococcus roseus]